MKRTASAEWRGDLMTGAGTVSTASGVLTANPYSFRTRFGDTPGTNPEELLAAAHAGCFSMALSAQLSKGGFTPKRVHTVANVHFDKVGEGFSITSIDLNTEAEIPGIDAAKFQEFAEGAKKNCPVSKALSSVPINFKAVLVAAAS